MEQRISKDEYYLGIAKAVAQRGVCFRRRFGAIIVRNDQIIATGYTGSPRKTKGCFERNECLRDKLNIPSGQRYELCRSVHAEMNIIINSARAGVSLLGGDAYIYGEDYHNRKQIYAHPCFICKKMIINAGLDRVICSASENGMKIFFVSEWIETWTKQDIIDDKEQYGQGMAGPKNNDPSP